MNDPLEQPARFDLFLSYCRVFGSVVVLDSNRFRNKTDGFPRLLQQTSRSCRAEGENSNRNVRIEGGESPIISLAVALSWPLSNPDDGMSTNSPGTRSILPN